MSRMYKVTIVYPLADGGYGSKKPIYEKIAVAADDEASAKRTATEVAVWRHCGPPDVVRAERVEFAHLGSGLAG